MDCVDTVVCCCCLLFVVKRGESGYFRIKRGNNECGIEDQITGSSADAIWSKGTDPRPGPEPKECLEVTTKKECLGPKEYGDCEWCDFGSNIGGCFYKGDKEPGATCVSAIDSAAASLLGSKSV